MPARGGVPARRPPVGSPDVPDTDRARPGVAGPLAGRPGPPGSSSTSWRSGRDTVGGSSPVPAAAHSWEPAGIGSTARPGSAPDGGCRRPRCVLDGRGPDRQCVGGRVRAGQHGTAPGQGDAQGELPNRARSSASQSPSPAESARTGSGDAVRAAPSGDVREQAGPGARSGRSRPADVAGRPRRSPRGAGRDRAGLRAAGRAG